MTSLLPTVFALLTIQGLLGAFDTVYHHELTVALPQQSSARTELRIHALRAIIYGAVFAGIAWLRFYGAWVWPVVALILVEIGLTLWDFVVEDLTRKLPASERITHTILAINGGMLFGFYGWQLLQWHAQPSSIGVNAAGGSQVLLTTFAIGVFASGVRDAVAAKRLAQQPAAINPFTQLSFQRVLVTGGTGFIGSALVKQLLDAGHAVTVLARDTGRASIQFSGRARCIASLDELDAAESYDVVVNLAGAPIAGAPWTKKRQAILLQSRIGTTQALGAWLSRTEHTPSVWIQASAIGYYGSRAADEILTEASTPGKGFASRLCSEWEAAARNALRPGMRQMVLRLGIVFGPGGALPQLLRPIRMGVGGRLGNGLQIMSWIHRSDVLAIMARAIADKRMDGAYNATAPQALSQRDFARAAGRILRRPVWFPIPAAPLRAVLGEMAELFVDGQNVAPARLKGEGFEFQYPDIDSAIKAEA